MLTPDILIPESPLQSYEGMERATSRSSEVAFDSHSLDEPLLESSVRPGKKQSIWSVSSLTIVLLGFLGAVEYSIIMPSLSEYVKDVGGSPFFYGICISAFPFSRLLSMGFIGYWSDKSAMVQPLLFCLVMNILGNILYASAQYMQSVWFIVIGRCCVGISSSSSVLSSTFITRVTTVATRTKALTTISMLNMVALVIGPATNLLTTGVHFKTWIDGLEFNDLTNPGWLMIILMTGLICVTLATFEEPARLQGQPESESRGLTKEVLWDLMKNQKIWVFYLFSWTCNYSLSGMETAFPALNRRVFNFNSLQNSLAMCVLGFIIGVSFFVMRVLSSRFQDRTFIFFGTTFLLIGSIIGLFTLSKTNSLHVAGYVISCVPLLLSIPLIGSPNSALYTKTLEKHGFGESIGSFTGVLQTFGSAARMVSPLVSGIALGMDGLGLLFGLQLAFSVLSFVGLLYCWRFLNIDLLS